MIYPRVQYKHSRGKEHPLQLILRYLNEQVQLSPRDHRYGGMSKIISIFKRQHEIVESRVLPHSSALYSQAYKYTANRDSAQDLVQEVLVYALENKHKILVLDPVLPWLMKCLYHRFVDHYRKHKGDRLPKEDYDFDAFVSKGMNAEDQYFYRQVHQGLAQLTAEQRVAVTLFDIEGYSLDDLAQVMDLPLGTVKSHLHRGRKRLKVVLELTQDVISNPDMQSLALAGDDEDEL
jgi:RNA polymerase sigma-70 factor, ECF subfamily